MTVDAVVTQLRKSPLDAVHRQANARMVPYAGWDMPLSYAGIAAEHMAVRLGAGIFDVSHMGEIEVAGKNALRLVQRVSCNDAGALKVGRAHYSALLTAEGTFIDDVLVHRLAPSHFLIVVNAANTAKAHGWIAEQASAIGDAAVVDSSSRYALIAVQGPAAIEVLQPISTVGLDDVARYAFTYGEVASARALIARTGYTGEDGFEIYVPPAMATRVWQALFASGRSANVMACGLAARDTLRLEAGMCLYGNDIDESTNLLEAGLGWMMSGSNDFIGRERLTEVKATGVERRLVGFELNDPGIARQGFPVLSAATGEQIGNVTSGTQTPFLKRSIGMAYVPTGAANPGAEVAIDIRGRQARGRIVSLPFYRRSRA